MCLKTQGKVREKWFDYMMERRDNSGEMVVRSQEGMGSRGQVVVLEEDN